MVSAGAANKKAFGIDRTTNRGPTWSAPTSSGSGSNVAECSPITTNYVWQAREQGAKVIVQDPRITRSRGPATPSPRSGLVATPRLRGRAPDDDRSRRIDRAFIDAHTVGFDAVAEYCAQWTPARTAGGHRRAERSSARAAELWGTAKSSFLFHARGIEHHSNGVQNALGTINLVLASGRIGKPNSGYGTIVGSGERPGRTRARAEVRPATGLARHLERSTEIYIASVWNMDGEADLPGLASMRTSCSGRSTRANQGLLDPLQPQVSLPDNQFVTRALEKLEFYVAIDFFLNDSAATPTSCCPAASRKKTKEPSHRSEGRVIKIAKAVKCPGEAREDWRIIQDLAKCDRPPARGFHLHRAPRSSRSSAWLRRAGVADYPASPTRRSSADGRLLAVLRERSATGEPTPDHPGTPRLFEPTATTRREGQRPVHFPDGKRASTSRIIRPGRRHRRRILLFLTTGAS